jgi:DNA mismatch repair protein MutS2
MNNHALRVLQLPETLDLIAGFASGPLGAERIRQLTPSSDLNWVTSELLRVEEMLVFLQRAESWAAPGLPDVRAQLRKLQVAGSVLDPAALREIALVLEASRSSARALAKHADEFPLLAAVGTNLVELEDQEKAIAHAIAEDATVRDNASRELHKLRREIRGARSRIVEKLEAFIGTLPGKFQVADASVSIRDGRYVIPVRREGRGDVGGIVHDESATGGTLFVEPPVAIELMNRLRELELAEAREVQRILRELTDDLRPYAAETSAAFEALIELDSLFARARYALRVQANRPEVLPAGTDRYVVNTGFHPLLQATGADVVPFDLTLEAGERTLLVSGPNTGGKTVLLKAIGLLSALTQSGVLPPVAAGTTIPLLEDIFGDIGDEQSIEASLSTFSAHLKNIREILEAASHTSLVLMDEIGSGTDPTEGGALARAVLVELTRRGALTVATTHLGQLKLLASDEPGVVNASLQFDSAELRPTYRLLKGVPGRSYGIAIARRLGFPGRILNDAESFLPRAERDAGQLLLELEEKDRQMSAALAATEAARAEADALRQELQERETEVRRRERDAERRARQQARDLLLNAREEVDTAIRELREAAAAQGDRASMDEAARAARRRVELLAQKQAEKTPDLDEPEDDDAALVEVGSTVRIRATGAVGRVLEIRDGKALVETGGLRLQIPASGITVTTTEPKPKPAVTRGGWSAPDYDASPEVDLRGLRADEVPGQLQPAVDAAVRAALASLRIIHGKGTGALRQVVAELLRADPRVKSFRPGGVGEGGAGVTVAELE